VVLGASLDGCGGAVVTGPLGDGGGGHTADPVFEESGPASIALILGARVLVGRPRGGGGGHTTDPISGESRLDSLALILGARVPVG
jgi:hypothetical protein